MLSVSETTLPMSSKFIFLLFWWETSCFISLFLFFLRFISQLLAQGLKCFMKFSKRQNRQQDRRIHTKPITDSHLHSYNNTIYSYKSKPFSFYNLHTKLKQIGIHHNWFILDPFFFSIFFFFLGTWGSFCRIITLSEDKRFMMQLFCTNDKSRPRPD